MPSLRVRIEDDVFSTYLVSDDGEECRLDNLSDPKAPEPVVIIEEWEEDPRVDKESIMMYHTRCSHKDVLAWYKEFKNHSVCTQCGESDSCCINFHHLDRADKFSSISNLVQRGESIIELIIELEKCIPLCANCHLKLHHGGGP